MLRVYSLHTFMSSAFQCCPTNTGFHSKQYFFALCKVVSANFLMDKCWLMHFEFPAFLSELYDNMLEWHFWTKVLVQIQSWTRPKVHFRSTWSWTKTFCVKKRFERLVIKFWAKYTEPLHNCDLPHVQKPRTRTRARRNFEHTWPLISDPTLHAVCNIHWLLH